MTSNTSHEVDADGAAVPNPSVLPGATCRYCGHDVVRVEWRMEALPVGTYSLAGVQAKFAAREWPWAVCCGCGHESRGYLEEE